MEVWYDMHVLILGIVCFMFVVYFSISFNHLILTRFFSMLQVICLTCCFLCCVYIRNMSAIITIACRSWQNTSRNWNLMCCSSVMKRNRHVNVEPQKYSSPTLCIRQLLSPLIVAVYIDLFHINYQSCYRGCPEVSRCRRYPWIYMSNEAASI